MGRLAIVRERICRGVAPRWKGNRVGSKSGVVGGKDARVSPSFLSFCRPLHANSPPPTPRAVCHTGRRAVIGGTKKDTSLPLAGGVARWTMRSGAATPLSYLLASCHAYTRGSIFKFVPPVFFPLGLAEYKLFFIGYILFIFALASIVEFFDGVLAL